MPFWCIRQPLLRRCTVRPSQDVSSPIPADHISNTNPLLGSAPLPAAAEAELLELHSKLAFHGRRLFRHEVRGGRSAVGCCTWCYTLASSAMHMQTIHSCAPTPRSPPSPMQVAATAWRLQFADHWQGHEAGGRSGDELRLAVAHLRAMLGDEDEIRWRRRGVQGLVSGRGCGHDMTANGIVCMQ